MIRNESSYRLWISLSNYYIQALKLQKVNFIALNIEIYKNHIHVSYTCTSAFYESIFLLKPSFIFLRNAINDNFLFSVHLC